MPAYSVTIPFTGYVTIEIETEDDLTTAEIVERAIEEVEADDWVEYLADMRFHDDRVYAENLSPRDPEVERVDVDDDDDD